MQDLPFTRVIPVPDNDFLMVAGNMPTMGGHGSMAVRDQSVMSGSPASSDSVMNAVNPFRNFYKL